MTLRAYRPLDNNSQQQSNEPLDWQDTLLERRQPPRQQFERAPRSRAWLLTGLFALAAILVTGYFVLKGRSNGDSIPLIAADTTAYKVRPDAPGGAEIPFQDKLVFNRLDPNGQPVQAEKLLPPPEEPMPSKPVAASAAPSDDTVATTAAPSSSTASAHVAAAPPLTVTPIAPPSAVAPAPIAAPALPVTQVPVAVAPVHSVPAGTNANPKTGTTASAPTAAAASAPAAPAPKVTTKLAPVAAAATMPTAAGQARIQLASIPDQANAQKALATLTAKYGAALGGAHLSLTKADIPGKGTYWRVQSQPLDRAAASSACSAVMAQGGTCILAR